MKLDKKKLLDWLAEEEKRMLDESRKCNAPESTMLYGEYQGINWVKQNIWAGNFDRE